MHRSLKSLHRWLATLSFVTTSNSLDAPYAATAATGRFATDALHFTAIAAHAEVSTTARLGYSVPEDSTIDLDIRLTPLREQASLHEEGVEILDASEELKAVGISEENLDLHEQAQRIAIGAVLLHAVERRFGVRPIHLADTSRISGNATYGEATVRDTSSPTLRNSHHCFHMDKNWRSIGMMLNSSAAEAVERTIDNYRGLWAADWSRMGVRQQDAAAAMLDDDAGMMVNAWVALTGKIEQQPLALIDRRSVQINSGSVLTMPVILPGLEESITMLRASTAENATFLWRPSMRFGEVLLFRTVDTPHSAVVLPGKRDSPRRSAEMRMLLLFETEATSKLGSPG